MSDPREYIFFCPASHFNDKSSKQQNKRRSVNLCDPYICSWDITLSNLFMQYAKNVFIKSSWKRKITMHWMKKSHLDSSRLQ